MGLSSWKACFFGFFFLPCTVTFLQRGAIRPEVAAAGASCSATDSVADTGEVLGKHSLGSRSLLITSHPVQTNESPPESGHSRACSSAGLTQTRFLKSHGFSRPFMGSEACLQICVLAEMRAAGGVFPSYLATFHQDHTVSHTHMRKSHPA